MEPPDQSSSDRPKPPHLRRSHTALPKLSSHAKRSHLPSLHHHSSSKHSSPHHHHGRHGHHSKDRESAGGVQLHHPTSLVDLLKSTSKSGSSRSPTRTDDANKARTEQRGREREEGDGLVAAMLSAPPKPVRPADVERERQRAKKRDEELQAALQALSNHSLETTRRLDVKWYAILEKVATLRSTIGALQELSSLTRDLHAGFQADAQDAADDVRHQLAAFAGFEPQARHLNALERRLRRSTERTAELDRRLEAARRRVDAREALERARQAQSRRRVRIVWMSLVGLACLALAFVVHHSIHGSFHPRSLFSDLRLRPSRRPRHTLDLDNVPAPPPVKEMLSAMHAEATSRSAAKRVLPSWSPSSPARSAANDDPRIRLLDEL